MGEQLPKPAGGGGTSEVQLCGWDRKKSRGKKKKLKTLRDKLAKTHKKKEIRLKRRSEKKERSQRVGLFNGGVRKY